MFAGDRRVWRAAMLAATPALLLIAFYSLRPRFYYTGTDSVAERSFFTDVPADASLCTPTILELPAGTSTVRLRLRSPARMRPGLQVTLHVGASTIHSSLAPLRGPPDRITNADFPIPKTPASPAARNASLCARSPVSGVEWAGSSEPSVGERSAIVGGVQQSAELAVWFLPPSGARRSYLEEASAIFRRAAMFRPWFVGAWAYWLMIIVALPALGLLGVRSLACAIAPGWSVRRAAVSLFAIAALNFACWALITPPFQAPDEVDHYAYTQSLVERGVGPDPSGSIPLRRWSSAESLALGVTDFLTDHEAPDTRMPGTELASERYRRLYAIEHPPSSDDGGYSTSAAHGPLYYLSLAPGYLIAGHGATFTQLTLMRITSALLGALAALFAFLITRELAPGRPWLAVLAGLLVVFEPMYGFISGAVNNDVGVNAAAAAAAFLLIRALRRGVTARWGFLTGVVLVALPLIKETGLSLYPVAALALLAALALHHRRKDLLGWLSLAVGAVAMDLVSTNVLSSLQSHTASNGFAAIGSNTSAANEALTHIPEFLSFLWQIFLPALPGMSQHFAVGNPAYAIFVKRGWGAFGWYDVFFPSWVYLVILAVMLATIPLGLFAARREWRWIRRNWLETLTVVLIPIAVIAGFEAAYFSGGVQTIIPTFGRYAFPAIAPLAVIVVGALHGFGRRRMLYFGVGLLVAMIALSYSAQLLTLTSFYA